MSSTSTRASTSWGGASSGTASEATAKRYVYTYPSKKALGAITAKVRTLTRQGTNLTLATCCTASTRCCGAGPTTSGTACPAATFNYLRGFTWRGSSAGCGANTAGPTGSSSAAATCPDGWWPAEDGVTLFNPGAVRITRYRYRGSSDPFAMARARHDRTANPSAWARGEPDASVTRTSGSEGGPGKRTDSKGRHRASVRPYVVCVAGGKEHAEALRAEVEQVIAPLGLNVSPEKTRVVSIDEGFDFLGFAIKRVRGRHGRMVIHTYPSKRSLQTVKAKVREITSAAPAPTRHPTSSCIASTACCEAGATTSATVCPRRHSAICATSPTGEWSAGCAANTENGTGAGCAAPTSRSGGPPTTTWNCSTRAAVLRNAIPLPGRADPAPVDSRLRRAPRPSATAMDYLERLIAR